jgi:hypothetical protein
MVLGEAELRNILRPPPASVEALPPNPAHPFQKSFAYYFRQRFLKHHTPFLVGYGFSIWCFVQLDSAMKNGKKKSYEHAIAEGHTPCECCRQGGGRADRVDACRLRGGAFAFV